MDLKKHHDIIVVTGGAGFIGSGVVRHLNNQGINHIVIIDDLDKTEKWRNLVGKNFLDIIPINQCFNWLGGRENLIKAFIHLGACSSTVETDSAFLLENNYRFSIKLAEYALKHNHRFIYASSAATYGDGSRGFSDDHEALKDLAPINMYGYSKHLFDLWGKNQNVLNKIVGLKYFNVYGPNEGHKGRMASAITKILPDALRDNLVRLFKSSEPHLYPDGGQKRDFIYVKDAVRMTCAFLENTASGIFNIGTGLPETWNALTQAVFKALGKKANIEYINMPADLIGKYQNYTCADMKKTQAILKECSKTQSLDDSVGEYVKEHLIPNKLW